MFLFLLDSYHFIVIVEAEEALEIFPICLKHSELQDDKCAILIDFFGGLFLVEWMFPIQTEGNEGQTYGHKRCHDGQFWHHNGQWPASGRHGLQHVGL